MDNHTPFQGLLQSLWNPFKNFKNIFNKDFIKERRHLHFSLSAVILFAFFVFAHFFMKFNEAPFWVVLLFGWFGAWLINTLREGYREDKYDYPFDWLDVFAGAWGGITASIVYMIIFK
jgi:hypothetical protein